ncbi:MAG: TRAP transporter large permease subunit, partial [Candidatus Heimdallarchaeota archaeon]|nr:TRAP transporter large permease subunit [Candidatus Heimdallarchaeota archaeon]MCK4610164.1 TRAP transporter large permease subunit [Candidatus Heimdallarchaeota archaeon]
LLTKEGVDSTKVTATGAIVVSLLYLILMDWKKGFEENLAFEHVPDNFLEALAKTVNIEAILIIFSIGIIVAITKGAGFFDFVSLYIVKLTRGDPKKLLLALGGLTFFVSMFFDNLSAIILLGSLTVVTCKQLELNPEPYVLFVGINTIIGGLPTPVSSIPNIIFFNLYPEAGMSFIKFTAYMFPIAILFFGLASAFFLFVYRKQLRIKVTDEKKEQIGRINPWSGIADRKNIWKSLILLGFLFVGFILTSIPDNPLDVALMALISVFFGLFLFRTDLKRYLREGVEWEMIIFAIALFVLMGLLTAAGALRPLTNMLTGLLGSTPTTGGLILVAVIIGAVGLPIAGFLNSFSAALIFSYIFKALPALLSTGLWFGFVLSGNIGGALTPLGSITILMSLEILNREGYPISFLKYVRKMLPLTLACAALGMAYSIILIVLGL